MTDLNYDKLWNKFCGDGSLLTLISDTDGLSKLVNDLVVTVVEDDNFEACATYDKESGLPMIELSTGCFDTIWATCAKGIAVVSQNSALPWQRLGFSAQSFTSSRCFAEFVAEIVMDLIIFHEMGHIARGHLARHAASCGVGLFEITKLEQGPLSGLQRVALELDADNFAIYLLMTFRHFFAKHQDRYQLLDNEQVFISTLGLAKNILFSLLADIQGKQSTKDISQQSLNESHWDVTHPHPSVRHEFSEQMFIQMADDKEQAERFLSYSEQGYVLFLEMLEAGVFDILSMKSWLHDSQELSEFLNTLVREIHLLEQMDWMVKHSRAVKAISDLQREYGAATRFSL